MIRKIRTDIKFAIIGTGVMAATMMKTFSKAGIVVTAVVSRDAERAGQFAKAFAIPAGLADLDSVLRRNDVDAVYIANAPQEHAKTCIAALEAGKAVLCEKPMALSEAEAQRVVDTARRTQTLCMEGLWTFFLPTYERVLELSRTRQLGRINSLIANFGYPIRYKAQSSLPGKDRGGVLLDRGIYLIALALKVLGPVDRVDAHLNLSQFAVDEDAFLQMRHSDGTHSQLSASFNSLMSNTATLACVHGMIQMEAPLIGSEAVSILRAPDTSALGDPAQPLSFREKIKRKLSENPQLRRLNQMMKGSAFQHLPFGPDRYLPELNHFVALLRAGAQESDIVPLDLSLEIQRIIGLARADHARRLP